MQLKKNVMLCVGLLWTAGTIAQGDDSYSADTARVNQLVQQSKSLMTQDAGQGLMLASQALELAKKVGFQQGEAYALKNIGMYYYYQGKPLPTLENWTQSLRLMEAVKDENGIANMLGNIGAIYANQGDDARALDHHFRSLKIAEKNEDKFRMLTALNNIAGVYFEKKGTRGKALDYLLRGLPLAEALGDKEAMGILAGNIGDIYLDRGEEAKAKTYLDQAIKLSGNADLPYSYNAFGRLYLEKGNVAQALSYHNQALELARKYNENHIVPSLQGIADAYIKRGDVNSALTVYHEAEKAAMELNSNPNLKELYAQMAEAYSSKGDYANAFKYQRSLDRVKDTLFNEITQKKLGVLEYEFNLQKKEGQINLLTKDKALQDAELQKQRFTKNALTVGLVLVFFISFGIYRNYRNKVKTNNILDHQKHEIEDLLLNILPAEVAQELQVKGHATPRNYNDVSVLFTDFKGFTSIADKMSPQDLVEELNACFMAFDDIIEHNKLEKIKTIGDAYMCAGGIPTEDENHIHNIIKASLEIQEYIQQHNEKRRETGKEEWQIRIGIHTGPLVAGVVGKKKYAYDIWGSTVNIASRMESNGVPGQVNISSAVYERIKHRYACTYRGKIYAKNVGEIDMYLIDHNVERYEEKVAMPNKTETGLSPEMIAG